MQALKRLFNNPVPSFVEPVPSRALLKGPSATQTSKVNCSETFNKAKGNLFFLHL